MNLALTQRFAIWRQRVDYQAAVLGIICTVIATLLMVGQALTKDDIAQRLQEDRQALLSQVLPVSYYDNSPFDNSVVIDDKTFSTTPTQVFIATQQGQVNAVLFELSADGYGGVISMLIALNRSGEIIGVRTLSHKETPGLADAIEISKSDWMKSFDGLSLANTPNQAWAVKKDGGQFDQFTGATITPRAIVGGVVEGLEFYARHAEQLTAPNQEEQADE